MILVDSSVWIDYLRGNVTAAADTLAFLLASESIAVGDLVLAEVLQGIRDDRKSGYRLLHDDRDFVPFVRYLGLLSVL